MAQKRHHIVPRFLLKRFAEDPQGERAQIWRLDKDTGKCSLSNINNEAAISNFYRLEDRTDRSPLELEDILAGVEGAAAKLISKLVLTGNLSMQERSTLALFVYLQHQRTPLAREWQIFGYEESAKMHLLQQLCDPGRVRQVLGKRFGTEEELEAWRLKTIEDLEGGVLKLRASPDVQVMGMLMGVKEVGAVVMAEMTWTGPRAPAGSQFILSDHPLAMHDPRGGDEPVAWHSSATVEATLPLDPYLCLLLTPGPPTYNEVQIGPTQVNEVNLRTYAFGQWAIYGVTAGLLQGVRSTAKGNPIKVARLEPRPPRITIFERYEGATTFHNKVENRPPARASKRRHRKG